MVRWAQDLGYKKTQTVFSLFFALFMGSPSIKWQKPQGCLTLGCVFEKGEDKRSQAEATFPLCCCRVEFIPGSDYIKYLYPLECCSLHLRRLREREMFYISSLALVSLAQSKSDSTCYIHKDDIQQQQPVQRSRVLRKTSSLNGETNFWDRPMEQSRATLLFRLRYSTDAVYGLLHSIWIDQFISVSEPVYDTHCKQFLFVYRVFWGTGARRERD